MKKVLQAVPGLTQPYLLREILFYYNVQFDPQTKSIRISKKQHTLPAILETFKILSDLEVKQLAPQFTVYGPGAAIVPLMVNGAPHSINSNLGNVGTTPTFLGTTAETAYVSKRLDFNPIKYVLLKSPNIGNFMTAGSFGERTIIKKIPVTVGEGEMILDDTRSAMDLLNCSKQTLRRLEFQLTDEYGNELVLQNQDVSFSLIFSLHQKE